MSERDNDKALTKLLNECWEAEGTDFEGDRTYRVHVRIAIDLIKRAYEEGKKAKRSKKAQEVDRGS